MLLGLINLSAKLPATVTYMFRICDGVKIWAADPGRLQFHLDVEEEKMKCDQDPSYVPSASFISNAAKMGPAELAIAGPFRAGYLYALLFILLGLLAIQNYFTVCTSVFHKIQGNPR